MIVTADIMGEVMLIFLAGCIAIIWLQVVLSKKKSKIWGLIIPMALFSSSLVMLLTFVAVEATMLGGLGFFGGFSLMLSLELSMLIFTNIPTIILLTMYFVLRRKIRKNKRLQKMTIEDLA